MQITWERGVASVTSPMIKWYYTKGGSPPKAPRKEPTVKQTTGRQAAAAVSPALAEAALQAAPKTGLGWPFDEATAWVRPLTWAEANPAPAKAHEDSARLQAQAAARMEREMREITEGSWAQPGRRAYTDVDGYDGEVIITRRYYEDGVNMATVEPAPGFPLFWDDQDTLDVDVRDLTPLA